MNTTHLNYVVPNNSIVIEENNEENINYFASPVIPHMQPSLTFECGGNYTSILSLNINQQCIDKAHSICDYSDDIFQTLRDVELNRRLVCFRSQQICQRPMLLKLLKRATEKHKLSRTTLHLALYFLDCFMDNYTIRADKLKLAAIACLILAAKLEETDVDMPKFADLNKLSNGAYTLSDFKKVECKILETFSFDLIRPTAATFAEHFANSIITLQDYHIFINHCNTKVIFNNCHQQQDLQTPTNYGNEMILNAQSCIVLSTPCPYTSYENMLTTMSKTFFDLIDISLSYLKFSNVRPSIIASACIGAVRQMYGFFSIWTPFLFKLTHCTIDMISAYMEAILAMYRIHYNNDRLQNINSTPNTPLSTAGHVTILCGSPDSGVVSGIDTNSTTSDTDNEDDCLESLNIDSINNRNVPVDSDDDYCLECPTQAKRRRIF